MTDSDKIKITKLLEEVALDSYTYIRKQVIEGTGDVFIAWAENNGASFKDEADKNAALNNLALALPEPTRPAYLGVNGATSTRRSKPKSKTGGRSSNDDTIQPIKYKPRTKQADYYICEHVLGASAKEEKRGQCCGYKARYWHKDHDTTKEACKDEDNSCSHSRCKRHATTATSKTKGAKSRQKNRKVGKNSVSLGDGDAPRLSKDETGELLKEKHVDKSQILDVVSSLRKGRRERKAKKEALETSDEPEENSGEKSEEKSPEKQED